METQDQQNLTTSEGLSPGAAGYTAYSRDQLIASLEERDEQIAYYRRLERSMGEQIAAFARGKQMMYEDPIVP